jgi:hypothetical protein
MNVVCPKSWNIVKLQEVKAVVSLAKGRCVFLGEGTASECWFQFVTTKLCIIRM